jgi:uncharacterized protein YutE (UPF0331/DUF86 family)
MTAESDIDVGIYFFAARMSRDVLEQELEDSGSPLARELWKRLDKELGREVELVTLNTAPAGLVASAMTTGIRCFVRDEDLFARVLRASTGAAEDFRSFEEEFLRVRHRSKSLSDADRARLERILDSLEGELSSSPQFVGLQRSAYMSDANFRRNAERWVENLVNASIDIAKILLASQGLPMPQTYRDALSSLSVIGGFEVAEEAASFTRVRNVLAHEYLDITFPEIQRAAEGAERIYGGIVRATQDWLKRVANPLDGPLTS